MEQRAESKEQRAKSEQTREKREKKEGWLSAFVGMARKE